MTVDRGQPPRVGFHSRCDGMICWQNYPAKRERGEGEAVSGRSVVSSPSTMPHKRAQKERRGTFQSISYDLSLDVQERCVYLLLSTVNLCPGLGNSLLSGPFSYCLSDIFLRRQQRHLLATTTAIHQQKLYNKCRNLYKKVPESVQSGS